MTHVIELGQDRRALAPFNTPGEFFNAVKTATVGGRLDPRLITATAGSDEHAEYAGGFLVPESHAPIVLSAAADNDPAAGRTLPVPMTTPIVKVAARTDKDHSTSVTGGLVVFRHSETAELTPSRMQMESITL